MEAHEEAKRQREHETEEAKRQREHELQVLAARTESNENGNRNFRKIPKIPVFSDGADMIDSYIQHFERFAQANNSRREEWARALSTLLTGKALDV